MGRGDSPSRSRESRSNCRNHIHGSFSPTSLVPTVLDANQVAQFQPPRSAAVQDVRSPQRETNHRCRRDGRVRAGVEAVSNILFIRSFVYSITVPYKCKFSLAEEKWDESDFLVTSERELEGRDEGTEGSVDLHIPCRVVSCRGRYGMVWFGAYCI